MRALVDPLYEVVQRHEGPSREMKRAQKPLHALSAVLLFVFGEKLNVYTF